MTGVSAFFVLTFALVAVFSVFAIFYIFQFLMGGRTVLVFLATAITAPSVLLLLKWVTLVLGIVTLAWLIVGLVSRASRTSMIRPQLTRLRDFAQRRAAQSDVIIIGDA